MYNTRGWQLLDYRTDSIFGAGVTRAYNELLKGKKSYPVIVAVIDRGVDITHEDLVGHIWTNKKEIPGNGIDDDHNGYVDDIHGWNFIGRADGKNLVTDSYESYREYDRLKNDSGWMDTGNQEDKKHYREKVIKYFLKDSLEQAQTVSTLDLVIPEMRSADSIFKISLRKDSIYVGDLISYQATDSVYLKIRNNTISYFRKYGISPDMSLGWFINEAEEYLRDTRERLKVFSGNPNALRKDMVGDDYNNFSDRKYGNNQVSADNTEHGTHVAGIIAASRQNGIGIDGIDDNVYVMPIRAVPDGDERDKDVALSIRYAVDNGARVINMSFGKYLSPGKKWVDDAVRYAADHDVLIVHAAGNESLNVDSFPEYPSPVYENGGSDGCCYLTVGSNTGGPDSLVVTRYSNYGKKGVDLFAPGVKIYSTIPPNQYAAYSGTSMAAPVVAGIAALLMEYYPELSARQVKYILNHSVMKLPGVREKWSPTGPLTEFSRMSASGGIVNAYNALQMAATMKGERKKP